jgi:hypothetical protein
MLIFILQDRYFYIFIVLLCLLLIFSGLGLLVEEIEHRTKYLNITKNQNQQNLDMNN